MDYFAGLDISMDETHVCVLDREPRIFSRFSTSDRPQTSKTDQD
jgi:transposase